MAVRSSRRLKKRDSRTLAGGAEKRPQPIVDQLSAALSAAMKEPTLVSQFKANGLVPVTMVPAKTKTFVDGERANWADVVKISGVKAD